MTRDGMNYSPDSPVKKRVVEPGEFVFAASHFDHGHINGQIKHLIEAGGVLKYVYDKNPERYASLLKKYPDAIPAAGFDEILNDPAVHLVTSAGIPNERCATGLRVLDAGKDYWVDKAPFTTMDQLAAARKKTAETGCKYMVNYGERLGNESCYHAGELVRGGAVGRVVQVLNLAPHNLAKASRPEWFFKKEQYGGILTDIGSHQFEQFLYFTGASGGEVLSARVENFANPDTPELEDFGEATLRLDTGASCYVRVDWLNPKGLRTWGDGRTFVIGEKGSLEIRKYVDVAREGTGNKIYLTDESGEHLIDCDGKVGFPFAGKLILDILNRTEKAMSQEHAFKAAELSMIAQQLADERRRTEACA
jgi:predicted dehydrogenase